MVASGTFEYFKAVPPFTMLRRLLNSLPFVKSVLIGFLKNIEKERI
jgi:hypothetical protein